MLLITPFQVVEQAFSPMDHISPSAIRISKIDIAQERFLRPVVGDDLFGRFEEGDYPDFVNQYIQPSLAHFIRYSIIEELSVQISDNGAVIFQSETLDSKTENNQQDTTTAARDTTTNIEDQTLRKVDRLSTVDQTDSRTIDRSSTQNEEIDFTGSRNLTTTRDQTQNATEDRTNDLTRDRQLTQDINIDESNQLKDDLTIQVDGNSTSKIDSTTSLERDAKDSFTANNLRDTNNESKTLIEIGVTENVNQTDNSTLEETKSTIKSVDDVGTTTVNGVNEARNFTTLTDDSSEGTSARKDINIHSTDRQTDQTNNVTGKGGVVEEKEESTIRTLSDTTTVIDNRQGQDSKLEERGQISDRTIKREQNQVTADLTKDASTSSLERELTDKQTSVQTAATNDLRTAQRTISGDENHQLITNRQTDAKDTDTVNRESLQSRVEQLENQLQRTGTGSQNAQRSYLRPASDHALRVVKARALSDANILLTKAVRYLDTHADQFPEYRPRGRFMNFYSRIVL